jgi:ribosomal-protein-alanine N-acetyltransferase
LAIIFIVRQDSSLMVAITSAGLDMKVDTDGRIAEFGEFPILESHRLVMRQLTMDDAEFYLRNFSDPTTVELTTFEAPKDLEAAKAELKLYCIDLFANCTGIRWGIVLKESGELVGTCGFHKWVKIHDRAEIGYDMLPEFRERGIMKEALTNMIDYIFGTVRLNRLEALIDPRNIASIRLVESLGFSRDGLLRENTLFRGRYIDDLVYSLLARDWRAR